MKIFLLMISFVCIAFTTSAIALPNGVFGLPESVISTGGTAQWEVFVLPDSQAAGLRTTLATEQRVAWLDLAVVGPAEVACRLGRIDSGARVEILVDGVSRAVVDEFQPPDLTLEVPAGAHVVRVAANPRMDYPFSDSASVTVASLAINPLTAPGKLPAALDNDLPWVSRGLWEVVTPNPEAVGISSIRALAGSGELKTGFMGPGFLDFRFALGCGNPDAGDASSMLLSSDTDPSLRSYFYCDGESPKWRAGRHWFPPGPQRVHFALYRDAASLVPSGLDAVRFTPSPLVSLADTLDASGVVWENDMLVPWVGTLRNSPSDDVVVSPIVTKGQTTTLATTLTGPGELSLMWSVFPGSGEVELYVAGQRLHHYLSQEKTRVTINLLDSTPTRIEWIVRGNQNISSPSSRLLLDDGEWIPFPATPLAEALDTSAEVAWSTHVQTPFTGRPHPAAKNGTAAYIALKPGEESWLEATVNGPGRFDFWLREAAGIPLPNYGYVWNYWALSIDGVPIDMSGNQWPEQWITGDGPHRIRLTFRHPSDSGVEWITGAVDDVTWIPMAKTSLAEASGLNNQLWHTAGNSPAIGFSNAGRTGGPAIVMNPHRWETSWVESYVMGPCELSWDSALKLYSHDATAGVEVNGVGVTKFASHSWQRMRLSLPKGIHSVRWVFQRNPPSDSDDPQQPLQLSQVWQIGGMEFKNGVSALALAVDLTSIYALETGDEGGQRIEAEESDFWKAGLGAELYFFHPRRTGKLSVNYQSASADGYGWRQGDSWQFPSALPSSGNSWLQHESVLHPAGFSQWSFDASPGEDDVFEYPLLDSMKFEAGSSVMLDVAMESPESVTAQNWFGVTDHNAPADGDFSWSLLNRENSVARASVILTGPANVSYWWRKAGTGDLQFSLNGAQLPVPPATDGWTKVEFSISTGNHRLEWTHRLGLLADSGETILMPSEAWLDGLAVGPTPPVDLTVAGTRDGTPVLTSTTGSPEMLPWQPLGYREANGTWTEAVRVVSGGRQLHCTVVGPAVVQFRARCHQEDVVSSPHPLSRSSGSIGIGNTDPVTTGHLLTVDVDGVSQLRVSADAAASWSPHAVHVPAGVHQVAFRLMAVNSWWFGTFLADATLENAQAWVDDIRINSSSGHYAEWAVNQGLAANQAGKNDDADADGSNNFMEYSFGTNSRDGRSRPLALAVEMIAPRNRLSINGNSSNGSGLLFDSMQKAYPILKIPYLPPHVSGVLESSDDLKNWEIEPIEMHRYPPFRSFLVIGGLPENTLTHHIHEISNAGSKRYYRLAIGEP